MRKTPDSVWTELVQPETELPHNFRSLASSVERASTVVFDSPASLRQRDWRDKQQYTYGLLGTPTTRRLERKLALVEGGEHCVLLPSGLAAVSLCLMALLKHGERVLMPSNAYYPASDMARLLVERYGVELDYYDPLDLNTLRVTANTRLVWAETPGSVTMEVADLPAIAAIAHDGGAVVVADATWGAGLAMDSFALGADISLQALTKYQSGGSDVMMGSLVTRSQALHEQLLEVHVRMGMGVSPEDCNIILRSLPHLQLRYQAQDLAAREIALWLRQQPAIAEVLHPALPGAPGHALWQRDFTGAASLFSVVFQPAITQADIDRCLQTLRLFHIGYSWGGSVSLAVPYALAQMHANYRHQGRLVRFYIGLESPVDLVADLQQALQAIPAPS